MIRIGVDTGGTFTDLVRLDDRGLSVHKVRSTPHNPAEAILAGIAALSPEAVPAEVIHGSTVATNAVLERKGARVAMVTTRGFEDVLAIGRQTRSRLYDFQVRAKLPIISRGLIFSVAERLNHRGEVLQPLAESEIADLADSLRKAKVDCVAICLLHSYANPVHELMLEKHLRAEGFAVSVSSRILPEYREYERWSTTAMNAYVMPIMSRYLRTLEDGLGGTRLHVMQSNGGIISADTAAQESVRTILSGPAAGAVGGQAIASASGFQRIILFDMGGTSTDVSLVDGRLGMTSESTVGGFPVRLPMLDIHTVGAGGGSIAHLDAGGSLRVGPRSAGADPGPVCYGKGEELTVSDANLLLGRLHAESFLGGRMPLDRERTLAHAEQAAGDLGMSVERLAEGIIQIANSNMEHAIRAVSVQRGFDPRDFALLAFGGAGGMHACEIAEKMEIDTVLIPKHAGVLSALGMLLADVRKDYTLTILQPASTLHTAKLDALFAPLVEQARQELHAEGFDTASIVIERQLDVRYRGQAYEIAVPEQADFEAEFHRRHRSLYGYSNPSRETEVVNIRVNAAGITKKYTFPSPQAKPVSLPAPLTRTRAWFAGGFVDTPVYRREDLPPGAEGAGPAILAGGDATVVITPSFHFLIDNLGTLVATRVSGALVPEPVGAFAEEGQ